MSKASKDGEFAVEWIRRKLAAMAIREAMPLPGFRPPLQGWPIQSVSESRTSRNVPPTWTRSNGSRPWQTFAPAALRAHSNSRLSRVPPYPGAFTASYMEGKRRP